MTAAGKSRSRATSREDLLYGSSDNRSQYALSTRSAGPYGGSRQQHNGRGGDENGFKARLVIQKHKHHLGNFLSHFLSDF